ncbi:MAG: DUF2797 domain-containing protein [Nanoarchaeota archaeon]|nr:DUF2797 domain-containing protein [Nanoarchaeota archaeon]MBU1135446.1 DUF2797 domain-containing protein [Nanoarchaeota archaeon]MBU2519688.1 DUF2797 domain-containing protein [Nanoarchaeota archaeon]
MIKCRKCGKETKNKNGYCKECYFELKVRARKKDKKKKGF